MSLIILEGLDRTGKSSVASSFEDQGYEIIHMSAPPKGQNADLFLEDMMDLVSSAASRNILLDRSYYGEACIWPNIYGRQSLLDEQGLEALREIEEAVGTQRILMHDPDTNAHWQRCVDNKEPLTKAQFVKARTLYSSMADKYGFERKTLKDFPHAIQPLPTNNKDSQPVDARSSNQETSGPSVQTKDNSSDNQIKTKEQLKLEKANVINEILSKRILKNKGPAYDELERNIRHFLSMELGKIFGTNTGNQGFSNEEIELLKFFCQRLKEKETS